MRHRSWPAAASWTAVSDRYPEVVLGAQAARTLAARAAWAGHLMIDLGGTWFTVIGIMRSAALDPALD